MKHNSYLQKLVVIFVLIFTLCDAYAWKPVIVGHRGSRTGVENTEEAFINGADELEHLKQEEDF